MTSFWDGKRVLITGVCGTVGRELLRQISMLAVTEIVGIDNNESELFDVDDLYRGDQRIKLYVADIRNIHSLDQHCQGIDIILHSAAFKHVILCEQSPDEAIQTNILGTQNVIRAALRSDVEGVLFTSSDKAVNPTNVMGTSKLMCERLITAANAHRRNHGPVFSSTRFGNVLGSRGSVIPLFRRQIAAGGPVTLTDERMTRFIMTLEEAVRLVMESATYSKGGEVFVTKMPVVRIRDLAEVMIEELAEVHGYEPADIEIQTIGSKPGEKLYEELMNHEETRRTLELPAYFVVLPAFKSVYEEIEYVYPGMGEIGIPQAYESQNEAALGRSELKTYLYENNLLDS